MTKPAIAFIIPAFNAAETILATLDSVRDQTVPSWEAIVIDDGSVDETPMLVAQRSASDDRVQLIRQENAGASAARNTGFPVQSRSGVFLDADDLVDARFIALMTNRLEREPKADLAYCQRRRFSVEGVWLPVEFVENLEEDPLGPLSRYCPVAIHSVLVPRQLVLEVGGFDPGLRTCEDWDLWIRLARSGARFGAVPECLGFLSDFAGILEHRIFPIDPRFAQGSEPGSCPRYPNKNAYQGNRAGCADRRGALCHIVRLLVRRHGCRQGCGLTDLLALLPMVADTHGYEPHIGSTIAGTLRQELGVQDMASCRAANPSGSIR